MKNKSKKSEVYFSVAAVLLFSIFLVTQQGCKKETPENQNIAQDKGDFKDARDGNIYKWVKIGNQVWMAENLNCNTSNSWWYNNSSENGDVYGRLYTWDAALTACPDGWHLPSNKEWKTMEMALGMSQSEADNTGLRGTYEGGKMKETGTTH